MRRRKTKSTAKIGCATYAMDGDTMTLRFAIFAAEKEIANGVAVFEGEVASG